MVQAMLERSLSTLRPKPKLTPSQWAETHRVLTREASAEPGPWRNARTPYLTEPMDALVERGVERVAMKFCTQVGKTEAALNLLGYFAHQDPSPIILIEPTDRMAEAISKDRIAPMIRESAVLRGLVADAKARDSDNTILHKTYPGGHWTLAGANSPASLASRPIRIVMADEVDRWPETVGTEGDPLSIVEERSATYQHRRRTVVTSSPTNEATSKIEKLWAMSDQRRYYVPCPHCGELQVLWFSRDWRTLEPGQDPDRGFLAWDKDESDRPVNVRYLCAGCGGEIRDGDKPRMLALGVWQATAPFRGTRGYHLSQLYSPWVRWSEIVERFYRAKADRFTLQVFINTSLAECYREPGEKLDPSPLYARRESYAADVPADAILLTCGVDVQHNRLELVVIGWGPGEQSWGIARKVMPGDTRQRYNRDDLSNVWRRLEDELERTYAHEFGHQLRPISVLVDSSDSTGYVYDFTRGRRHRGVYACKGRDGASRPIAVLSRSRSGKDKKPVDLWIVGVDEIKSAIFARLSIREPGPGMYHWPLRDDFDEEYFRQLTNERAETVAFRGFLKRRFRKVGANEVLDCNVYAYAALHTMRLNWEKLSRDHERMRLEWEDRKAHGEQPKPVKEQPRRVSPRRKGWVNRWRG